ncbi:MAG: chlorite dismutase family protein [Firmicutes bacterium]|jgi:chlorite dismutase|nr:chlorite dismutase family protein [Bacillota bacterium]
MDATWTTVHVLALQLDPAWRRLADDVRRQDAEAFLAAATAAAQRVRTYTYSMIGLQADADLLWWRLAPSVEVAEETAASLLRAGLGRFLRVTHAMVGLVRPSVYVKQPTVQEQAMFVGTRNRYLIVYPFVKTTSWYLTPQDERQRMMNEHIRVGHRFPMVRQLLAYSFGLDDQEFIVAYETDDLQAFQDLVQALRATEARRYTVRDTPLLLGVHRPLSEIVALLGAPLEAAVPRPG